MKDSIIRFEHVTKRYKLYKNDKQRLLGVFFKGISYQEKLAVDDVSFQVARGDSVAFFGRNGAGKSTILKMITGVCYPSAGSIHVGGRVSALLELTTGFDMEMTGRENIYLKGQLCGLPDEEIAGLEQEIVDFAELEEYIDQPVRTYSSGMRARLGFAVNVNIRPEILIVDEALSVGDKEFRAKCLEKVNDIIEHDNVTLLFVTHSTGTARQFCRRGIYMVRGQVCYDGDIETAIDLYEASTVAVKLRRRAKRSAKAAQDEAQRLQTAEARERAQEAARIYEEAKLRARRIKKMSAAEPEAILQELAAGRAAEAAWKAAEKVRNANIAEAVLNSGIAEQIGAAGGPDEGEEAAGGQEAAPKQEAAGSEAASAGGQEPPRQAADPDALPKEGPEAQG